jgi:hypothetical protein
MHYNPVTGLMEDTVSFEEIAERIGSFHRGRWARWFRFVPYRPPEVIAYTEQQVAEGNAHLTPSYFIQEERIRIYLPQEGLPSDVVDQFPDAEAIAAYEHDGKRYAWSDWQLLITEEICHEFQHRAINNRADQYGEHLFAGYGPLDQLATGHTKGFSTAVGQFAATFGLDPHRTIRTLKLGFLNHAPPANDPWAQYLVSRIIPEAETKLAAYLRYRARDPVVDGHDLEDWYSAEQQLRAQQGLHAA